MTLFGKTLETQKFYVVEIHNGKEIRITANFAFLADAEAAVRRMPKGNYKIKTA